MLHSKMANLSFSKLVSLTIVLLCMVGFIFQIKEVCIEYFNYTTITKTMINIGSTLSVPSLVVCPKIVDILDRFNASVYGILPHRPILLEELKEEYGKLTVGQIFNLTPPT